MFFAFCHSQNEKKSLREGQVEDEGAFDLEFQG
jgi:hypothetical protein